MDGLQTVSNVTRNLGISGRMLRYYEQIGLLESKRLDGYSYRVYDETAVRRLRQIIVLRKLRMSVKQICEILSDGDAAHIVDVFERNISELDEEVTALSTARSILARLATELHEKAQVQVRLDWLKNSSVVSMVEALTIPQNNLREEKTMSELNQANEKLNMLTDKQVRIVYLPPATVAAYQYEGDEPEMHVGQVVDKFVRDSDLVSIKPDMRHYGFNAPNPVDETGRHGYEMWVTIPDGMEVPEPLIKKQFAGGLYTAHMIPFGAFEEWGWLWQWAEKSKKYERNSAGKGAECMFGLLEENLNYVNNIKSGNSEPDDLQLDFLLPIKERQSL